MTILEVVALVIGSGGIGAILSALVNWAANRGQVRVDHFRAITDALNRRIDDLQEEVNELRRLLNAERADHHGTRRLLGIAWRHVQHLHTWLDTGQRGPRPPMPEELHDTPP